MSELARTTGRGVLFIGVAKAWFMVTGAIINLGLPSFFALHGAQGTEAFGDYGVVINLVSVFNMVMITGTLQAVSKLVSERPEHAAGLVRQALRVQLYVGVPIACVYAALAPVTAELLNDTRLTPYIQLSGLITLSYCFYAIFVGYFNGTKAFGSQAKLDMAFATLKAGLIVGAVVMGLGVMGAVGGFASTAVLMTVFSALWVRRRTRGAPPASLEASAALEASTDLKAAEGVHPARRMLGYMLAIMLYTFFINLIIRADLFLLKSVAAARLEGLGFTAAAGSRLGSELSGLYTGVANIARLPYQAVIVITFVAFPVISRATFEGDRTAAKDYIRTTLRYSLLFIVILAALLIGHREPLLSALYPDNYAAGEQALLWLSLGMLFFAVMFVGTTILISGGHPVRAIWIGGGTLAVTAALNYGLLSTGEVDASLLERAGMATALGIGLGMVATLILLYRAYQATIPWQNALRILLVGGLVAVVTPLVPLEDLVEVSGIAGLVVVAAKMLLFGGILLGLLVATGELNRRDWDRLKSVFGRRS